MTTLLVIDEDRLLRESLAKALETTGLHADTRAEDWPSSAAFLGVEDIDLALVSSTLPDGAFEEACQQWSQHTTVLGLSKRDHETSLIRCLEAGGAGVVTADSSVTVLVGTIQAALRGEACVPRGMLGELLRELILRRRRHDEVEERFRTLTARERQVLQGLAAGQDVDALARALFISPQTVRSHTQRVLDKLGVHSRAEAVSLALDHELIEAGPVQG